jgi:hypothetical protein
MSRIGLPLGFAAALAVAMPWRGGLGAPVPHGGDHSPYERDERAFIVVLLPAAFFRAEHRVSARPGRDLALAEVSLVDSGEERERDLWADRANRPRP